VDQLLDVDAKLDSGDAIALIERILERVAKSEQFWKDLSGWWYSRQSAWFASGQIPPNAPATTRRKGSARPLVDTGALRDSTRDNQPFNLSRGQASFGLRKGTPSYLKGALNAAGPRGAPPRVAVPALTGAERSEIRDLLANYILRGLP
jgi:hypothetical protein